MHNQVTEIARQVISDEPVISIRLPRDADTRREGCIAFVWPPQPVRSAPIGLATCVRAAANAARGWSA